MLQSLAGIGRSQIKVTGCLDFSVSIHKKFTCKRKWTWASYKLPQLWRNNVRQAKETIRHKKSISCLYASNKRFENDIRVTKNIKYLGKNLIKRI